MGHTVNVSPIDFTKFVYSTKNRPVTQNGVKYMTFSIRDIFVELINCKPLFIPILTLSFLQNCQENSGPCKGGLLSSEHFSDKHLQCHALHHYLQKSLCTHVHHAFSETTKLPVALLFNILETEWKAVSSALYVDRSNLSLLLYDKFASSRNEYMDFCDLYHVFCSFTNMPL